VLPPPVSGNDIWGYDMTYGAMTCHVAQQSSSEGGFAIRLGRPGSVPVAGPSSRRLCKGTSQAYYRYESRLDRRIRRSAEVPTGSIPVSRTSIVAGQRWFLSLHPERVDDMWTMGWAGNRERHSQ
jgi:hypothetical protein